MIYITGDIHGDIDIHKLSNKALRKASEESNITEGDYLIICGDFGLVWSSRNSPCFKSEQYWINWLCQKPYTILFVDGNHENHDMLDAMTVSEWNGGKVHFISDNIIHLMRGQVFEIEGKSIFTMGGADSADKQHRIEGKSWWRRELPDQWEYDEAVRNLKMHNNNVDFIISHCAPYTIHSRICLSDQHNDLIDFFENIDQTVNYKRWYNGHYHCDMSIDRHFIVYDRIMPIG